jgi:glycosyltransferase involved in cell wall biosynthesis
LEAKSCLTLARLTAQMRIFIVSHTYVLKANRGKIDALARVPGLEILLVVPRSWRNRDIGQRFRADPAEADSVPVTQLRAWSLGSGSLITYGPLGLIRALRRFRPDLVHVEEEPWSLAAVELTWMTRLLRVPFTFFTWENSGRHLSLPFRVTQGSVLRRASAAVAGNAEAKDRLGRLGFKKPMVVLPQLGVDPRVFQPSKSGDPNRKVVGFVGRLVPHKGLLPLVEALGRMAADVRLMVVGNGPLKAELLRRAQALRLGSRLELHEGVSHQDVPRYLQQMSVLVLPSLTTDTWKEQFGHVLIEAMACGVPVVGSDSGAIQEVIGDAGIVVPEGDVTALAGALDLLLSDPVMRKDFASRGQARVFAEYTDDVVASRLAAFWSQLLGVTSPSKSRPDPSIR